MKKIYIILIIIFILIAGIFGYFYVNIKFPMNGSVAKTLFEIKDGDGTFDIADNLETDGYIKSAWIFAYYSKIKGVNFYPGKYYLSKNMNVDEVMKPLGNKEVQERKIVIPEGYDIYDIASYLEKNNIMKKEDFLFEAKGHEGYLFPDTYNVSIDVTAKELVDKMLENFNVRTMSLNPTKDQIILASIVEREAKKDADRAGIAGVFLNRVENDMYLGSDATVQYAKGSWAAITKADITGTDSPYNTYLYKGLPPAPICNPGLASIKAAMNPVQGDLFYFFTLRDGTTIFSHNGAEHDRNLLKYANEIAN